MLQLCISLEQFIPARLFLLPSRFSRVLGVPRFLLKLLDLVFGDLGLLLKVLLDLYEISEFALSIQQGSVGSGSLRRRLGLGGSSGLSFELSLELFDPALGFGEVRLSLSSKPGPSYRVAAY